MPLEALAETLREAWRAMALAAGLLAALGLLYRVLAAAGGTVASGPRAVAAGISGMAGILAVVLFGLAGVPEIARAARAAVAAPACDMFVDMARAAAYLVGAIGSLRMMAAVLEAMAAAAVGGSASLARAMLAAAEAVVGMALSAAVLPIVTRFLGAC